MNKLLLTGLSFIFGIVNAQPTLVGTTSEGGGIHSWGTIFACETGSTNVDIVKSFEIENPGAYPSGPMIKATNGKLYGLASFGGDISLGIGPGNAVGGLYEYDATNDIYTIKYPFPQSGINGFEPSGHLFQANDGKLYGISAAGGTNNHGVLFCYEIVSNTFTKLVDFDSATTGRAPCGAVVQANNGKIYGITASGGSFNKGVIFEYTIATGVIVKKMDFNPVATGNPAFYNSMILASNGKLYGLTWAGGTGGDGVIFEYDPTTNIFTKKYDFVTVSNGLKPYSSLIQGIDGMLYGLTHAGGSGNKGVIFRYNLTTSTYTKLINFSTALGSLPHGKLMQANNGLMYGMTTYDGVNNVGTIFEYNTVSGICTKLHDFTLDSNGYNGRGAFIEMTNGLLYAALFQGGVSGRGCIAKYDYNLSVYSKMVNLEFSMAGCGPNGRLSEFTNGKLYGASGGGYAHGGLIYEFDPETYTYVVKVQMTNPTSGYNFRGNMLLAPNGKFYGTTTQGGANNAGVIFEYDAGSNSYIEKFHFLQSTGWSCQGELVLGTNGMIYGSTYAGGTNNFGTIFEYDYVNNIYTKKFDFTGAPSGCYPMGGLTHCSNGKIYGLALYTTSFAMGNGTLYEYDYVNNVFTKLHDFSGINGAVPQGGLLEASNGNLYGFTSSGGTNNIGVIFEFNTSTNTLVKKLDLHLSVTGYPHPHSQGRFISGANGKLYAALGFGGSSLGGVLCEYDFTSNTFIKKFDFGSSSAVYSMGTLTEICMKPKSVGLIGPSAVCAGTYQYTIQSQPGVTYSWNYTGAGTTISATDTVATLTFGGSSTSGTLEVTGTNVCGSKIIASLSVTVNPATPPVVSINATQTEICLGDTTTLTATGANVYSWTNGVINNVTFSPTNTTTYIVTGTDTVSQCTDTSQVTIVVNSLPAVGASNVDTLCLDDPALSLTGVPFGGTWTGTGVTANQFDPAVSGVGLQSLTYTYTNANGCSNSTSDNIFVDACAGIMSSYMNDVQVYPNPFHNNVIITTGSETHQVQIINAQGKIVFDQRRYFGKNFSLDLSAFTSGIYVIKIGFSSGEKTLRLIKM